jgi:hypothetical protein
MYNIAVFIPPQETLLALPFRLTCCQLEVAPVQDDGHLAGILHRAASFLLSGLVLYG